MAPDTDRKSRDSTTLPEWLQKAFGSVIPTALLVAVGTGLVTWSNVAVLADRVERLESFANRGDRFTASDGRAISTRVDQLETWQRQHIQFGYEYVGAQNEKLADVYRRLKHIEDHVEESK